MNKQQRIAQAIKDVISQMMDKVLVRVLEKDPFIKEEHHASKPLYAALVPDEIFKGSHFERRFVTPFGRVWEKLAEVVAIEAHGSCQLEHKIKGNIPQGRLKRIQEILNQLEYSKGQSKKIPDWDKELKYIRAGRGKPIPVDVVCDLFIHNQTTNLRYAFELKAPLPNSDQTKVSKEKLFKLLAMEPIVVDQAYFALPYNPYGQKKDYAWTFPMRWFNMHQDRSVLIGNEFWDLIGEAGTYDLFIREINSLGKEYKERIYREFLGIEPPHDVEQEILK